ncbi:MAG: hypothetical protein QM598_11665 [Protaetiibacter sp.]
METASEPAAAAADSGVRGSRRALALAWLWIAGGSLTSVALVLLATLPPMPAGDDAVAGWIDGGAFQLTWAGELLFFAIIAWGSGALSILGARIGGSPLRSTLALVALGVALIALLVVLLALGRLVYPVVERDLDVDTSVLLVSVVVGSVHLALLALAVVAISFPLPAGSPRTARAATVAGVIVGAAFVAGSFPWLLPMWLNLSVAGLVGCWALLVGIGELTRQRGAPSPDRPSAGRG